MASSSSVKRTNPIHMAIEDLSEDLLMEILLRLPVKSLLRFKSVCKNWYALLQTPSFIYRHHDRAASIATDENSDCLLVKRSLEGGEGGVALSFVPNETPTEDIDISSTGLDIKQLQILGPCNGVVCLTRFALNSTIVICNPSMREFRVLPQPSYKNDHMSLLGFGYNPFADDYKVVRFGMMTMDLNNWDGSIDERVEIYDLSTDLWREVDAESPIESGFHCCHYSYVSWNWDCFWYAYRRDGDGGGAVIMAFSMSDEEFEEIPVPEVCLLDHHSEKKLFVLNDSLAMVIYPKWWSNPLWFQPEDFMSKSFDIWIMHEDGDEDDVEVSWTKKFTVGPFQGLEWALGFRQSDEFLLESNYGQMISYNLSTGERKEYQVHDKELQGRFPPPNLQVLLYTGSLVSVKRRNEHDGPAE